MKKLISIFILIISLTACDPPKWTRFHSANWHAKNVTQETLIITSSYFRDERLVPVLPGDSVTIFHFNPYQYLGPPSFGVLYEERSGDNIEDQDRRIDILSESGEVLRTWTYPEKDNPGKQFFNESPWKLYTRTWKGVSKIEYCWVFDISPEDIGE